MNWLPVKGYEGYYEVSDTGLVKRIKGGKGARVGKCLSAKVCRNGYAEVILAKDCEHRTHSVHRLVALAFLPNPERKADVNHLNGDKLNNAVENLQWATRSENNIHALQAGLRNDAGANHWTNRRGMARDSMGRFTK